MWFWLTRVQSESMAPTLPAGALAVTWSLRRRAKVRRRDVVVVDSAELGRRVIKRVIGLPGETIRIDDGRVHVDGARLDEPYASRSRFRSTYHVPDGHYFLLGDNRDASSDSRSWTHPFIDRRALRARVHVPGHAHSECAATRPTTRPSARVAGLVGGLLDPISRRREFTGPRQASFDPGE